MVIPKNDARSMTLCTRYLKRNRVIVVPCDTIYGFVGRVPDTDSRIRQIKGREEKKPFLMLIASPDIRSFSETVIPPALSALWPGPLTMIVTLNEQAKRQLGFPTAAVRCPDDPFLIELIRSAGGWLYSTSVNRCGSPPLTDIASIAAEFADEVPLLVDGGSLTGQPSTLLDLTVRPFRLLRRGALKIDDKLLK